MLATRPHGPAAALAQAVGGTKRWLELDVRVPRSTKLSVNLTKGKAFTLINYRRPGAPVALFFAPTKPSQAPLPLELVDECAAVHASGLLFKLDCGADLARRA